MPRLSSSPICRRRRLRHLIWLYVTFISDIGDQMMARILALIQKGLLVLHKNEHGWERNERVWIVLPSKKWLFPLNASNV
jgi:hypothetical protein